MGKEQEVYVLRELDKFASVSNYLKEKNFSWSITILEQKIIESNYYISRQLQVPLATKLFYMSRLRTVEGKPRSIEKNYIVYSHVEGFETVDFENKSFYSILEEKKKVQIVKSQEEILIVEANEKECELLQLEQGSEVVMIKGTTYKDQKQPFEYFELISEPSFYHFRSITIHESDAANLPSIDG